MHPGGTAAAPVRGMAIWHSFPGESWFSNVAPPACRTNPGQVVAGQRMDRIAALFTSACGVVTVWGMAALSPLRTIGSGAIYSVLQVVFSMTKSFTEFAFSVRLKPNSPKDAKKLSRGLEELADDGSVFHATADLASGDIVLHGRDEYGLDEMLERLMRHFSVEMSVGPPEVAYRETISIETELTYTHKQDLGRSIEFAEVTMFISPNEAGHGNTFESRVASSRLPIEFVSGVEAGVRSVWDRGPRRQFPVMDVSVVLADARFLDIDSNVLTFEIAARMCVREALRKFGILLEPIARVEVTTDHEYVGVIVGDLTSRRGHSIRQEAQSGLITITSLVPFSNMMGYQYLLLSNTHGTGKFSMEFDHYAPCPPYNGPDDDPPPIAAVVG